MASVLLIIFFMFLAFNSGFANSCGGLLEGEYGHFSLADSSNLDQPEALSSSCMWIIQLHYKATIRFTLVALREDSHLDVYPEDGLTSCDKNSNKMLNSTHVGSAFEFLGKTLIVVLPNALASVEFLWEYVGEDYNGISGKMKNSDYVSSPNGYLEWRQLEIEERVTWTIASDAPVDIRWNIDVATSCDTIDNCACFHFAIFQLNSKGRLSETVRVCGQPSKGQLQGIGGHAVVLIKINKKVDTSKIAVSWGLQDGIVTEPPVTRPPVPAATGLFTSTDAGLIAVDLQTLETRALTSEPTLAVAVNNNLKKVYWSEVYGNSTIVRSNFDGSAKEILVPKTGDDIYMLTIDEESGNVVFALYRSHEITLCNALGKSCSTLISDASIVSYSNSIALDIVNGFMYWGKRGYPNFLVRANLDGSNALIIATGFTDLHGITLGGPSNHVLYWVDWEESTIGTIDIDGGNKFIVMELDKNLRPYGIQVDAHKLYFSTWIGRNVQSVDRDSGKEIATIFNATAGVRNLVFFSACAIQSQS